nr:MAG TPA: hypothetical protein [Bacteriophage sp.]
MAGGDRREWTLAHIILKNFHNCNTYTIIRNFTIVYIFPYIITN